MKEAKWVCREGKFRPEKFEYGKEQINRIAMVCFWMCPDKRDTGCCPDIIVSESTPL